MERIDNKEKDYSGIVVNGFLMFAVNYLLLPLLVVADIVWLESVNMVLCVILALVLVLAIALMSMGYFSQQPNESRVMVFFGKYKGTCRQEGFHWVNPLMSKKRVSLRLRNIDVEPIKVNDKTGNPIMIGMVLVWKVDDTYRAVFDVDCEPKRLSFTSESVTIAGGDRSNALMRFVSIQSDAALREVASSYAYDATDSMDGSELTLRSGGDEINELLERKINERLAMAGIKVVEARLNYLAYAPEIAAVMLRRQQAAAIITAREKIVEGAVTMVKMAIDRLDDDRVVELDEERKAAMVSNLLVVLCADEPAQPVLNTGSLYQ